VVTNGVGRVTPGGLDAMNNAEKFLPLVILHPKNPTGTGPLLEAPFGIDLFRQIIR
jgi:hypothetical protein